MRGFHFAVAAALALVAAPLLFVAAPVQGGAFLQEQGHGQVIITSTWTRADRSWDNGGNLQSTRDSEKVDTTAFIEYGLTPWLTLVAQPSFIRNGAGTPNAGTPNAGAGRDTTYEGLGYTDGGGRVRLHQGRFDVVSAQALLRIPGTDDAANAGAAGMTDTETDLRLLYGRGFATGTWQSFLDVQGGYRFRSDNPPDEFHGDLTFGTRPHPKLLLLAQSFNTVSNGNGENGFTDFRYHKVQLGVVYDLSPRWSVSAGAMATVDGVNAPQETGGFAGLWFRF